jgi:hypothetical protein
MQSIGSLAALLRTLLGRAVKAVESRADGAAPKSPAVCASFLVARASSSACCRGTAYVGSCCRSIGRRSMSPPSSSQTDGVGDQWLAAASAPLPSAAHERDKSASVEATPQANAGAPLPPCGSAKSVSLRASAAAGRESAARSAALLALRPLLLRPLPACRARQPVRQPARCSPPPSRARRLVPWLPRRLPPLSRARRLVRRPLLLRPPPPLQARQLVQPLLPRSMAHALPAAQQLAERPYRSRRHSASRRCCCRGLCWLVDCEYAGRFAGARADVAPAVNEEGGGGVGAPQSMAALLVS